MSHTIKTVAAGYAAFLKAGTSYGAALQAAVRETSVSHPELLAALAKVHAKHYACNTTWSAQGTAVFHTGPESTRETRHVAAQKSWSRNVGVHFSTGETARSHHHQPVAVKRAKVNAIVDVCAGLTKAEVVALLAAVRETIKFE
jgi:hypothetical protein